MPTDKQIAVMVDVAQSGGATLNAEQELEVPGLVSDQLIAASENEIKYKLTDKGQKLLDDRGVGANES